MLVCSIGYDIIVTLLFFLLTGGKATQRTSPGDEANKFALENPSFTNEALKEANEFPSENPFFIVIIDPNQLRKGYRPVILNYQAYYHFNIIWCKQQGKSYYSTLINC